MKSIMDYGNRIPLHIPIKKNSKIQALLTTKPQHFDSSFTIDGKNTHFIHFVGITKNELEFAKKYGDDKLVNALKLNSYYPITDLNRESIFLI